MGMSMRSYSERRALKIRWIGATIFGEEIHMLLNAQVSLPALAPI
jgi:hypothetical protein